MNTRFSSLTLSSCASLCRTLFVGSAIILSGTAAHATATDTELMMQKAINTESQAQSRQNAWNEEQAAIVEEIRQLKSENLWLSFQEKKYSRYVTAVETKIAELNQIKAELLRLEEELEPLLYEIVERLKKQVNNDLPFLPEERAKRLNFLDQTLDDHSLSKGEKLRRILEAVEVETTYGRSAELTEETVSLDGKPTQVTIIRAGRLGLYCITPDNLTAGKYTPESKTYQTLPEEFAQPISQMKNMLEQKQVTDFVYLPMEETR